MFDFAQKVDNTAQVQEALMDDPRILTTYIPIELTPAQQELSDTIASENLHIKFKGIVCSSAEKALCSIFSEKKAHIRRSVPIRFESLEIPGLSAMRMGGDMTFHPRDGGAPFLMNDFKDLYVREFTLRGNIENMIITDAHPDYTHTTACIYMEGDPLYYVRPDGHRVMGKNLGPVAQFHRGRAHPLAKKDPELAVQHYRKPYEAGEHCSSLHFGMVDHLPV